MGVVIFYFIIQVSMILDGGVGGLSFFEGVKIDKQVLSCDGMFV